MLPSTVKSAMLSMRYVIKTPMVMTAHNVPRETAPNSISSIFLHPFSFLILLFFIPDPTADNLDL